MKTHIDRLIRCPLIAILLLVVGQENASAAWGVLYSIDSAIGQLGGSTQSVCTGFLQNTVSYAQPPEVLEASDTFERSGTMTTEGSVAMGEIHFRVQGTLTNQLTSNQYGAAVASEYCQGALLANNTQWNDSLNITGSGTFAFTVELDSAVAASAVKPGGFAGHGVYSTSRLEARIDLSATGLSPQHFVVQDRMDDGDQSLSLHSFTQEVNLNAGMLVDIAGSFIVDLIAHAVEGELTWDFDSLNTARYYVTPVTPGAAYTSESGIDYSAPVPMQRFGDVPIDYWAYKFIEALADSGITAGCGGGNYCPEDAVTRAQMAVFLERGINGSGYSPPPPSGNLFFDVPADAFAASFIEQLYLDGITAGCGNLNYCPSNPVTRGQMAVFLLRAKHGSSYTPPPPSGVFDDVPLNDQFVAWIEQLAAEAITSGCGGGNYCPEDPVTRAQMAVFLVRAFGL